MQLSGRRTRRRGNDSHGLEEINTKKLWAGLAMALALGALVASTASAHPRALLAASAPPPELRAPSAPTNIRVVRVTTANGFSWGDAAIGGAAVLALTMIAVGGVRTVSQREIGPGSTNRPALSAPSITRSPQSKEK